MSEIKFGDKIYFGCAKEGISTSTVRKILDASYGGYGDLIGTESGDWFYFREFNKSFFTDFTKFKTHVLEQLERLENE